MCHSLPPPTAGVWEAGARQDLVAYFLCSSSGWEEEPCFAIAFAKLSVDLTAAANRDSSPECLRGRG